MDVPEFVPRSVNRVLARAAARHPDTVAVETDDDQLTYGELHDASLRLAGGLADRGVSPGARVAACLGNGTEIVIAFYAAQRLGAIWVGINGQLAAPEQAHLLRETSPSVFLTTANVLELLAPLVPADDVGALAVDADGAEEWSRLRAGAPYDGPDVDPLGPAAIAFTSGTSGVPKGVVHSQHNLVLPGEVLTATRGYDARFRRGDSLPLTILNLIVLSTLTAVQAGGTSVLTNPKHADALAAWIGEKQLTVINAVPPILHSLIHSPGVEPRDLASLREVATGGAPCPEEIRTRFHERFGLPVHSTYGLTEAPSIVSIDDLDDPGPPQTSGRPLPHLDVAIDPKASGEASGEVTVAAARSGRWAGVWRPALGYWGRDDEASDTLRTGDFGRIDDQGRLVILERLSSVILRGGANVYPAEVERVLRDLHGVADAVVVGLPDERLGQTVHAVVELEPGATRVGDELVDECRGQLARYKTPEHIVVVDAIERNALGKPNRQWAVEQLAREGAAVNDVVVDFDNHYYEPEDAFTRFGDDEVKRYVRWMSAGKRKHLVFGNAMATAIPNPTFDPIAKPGALHRSLKERAAEGDWSNLADNDPRKYGELERLPAYYRDRDARLAVMTEQGVTKAVMFPTLGVGIEGLNADDARMTYKLFRAFNRWLDDDWGFAHRDRIYAAPHIPLIDPTLATEELGHVLDAGARAVALRPGPAYGRSPADPVWDPFWARLQEAGIPAAYHSYAGPDVYDESWRLLWQRYGSTDPRYEANLRLAMTFDRGMVETALALVLGNLFGRFPGLRMLSIELGAGWVSYVMHMLDHAVGLTERHIEAFGVTVAERPSEVFKRHFWISPFPEEDLVGLTNLIGVERVLFGSDWPHAEGTEAPLDYAAYLAGLEPAAVRRIMCENGLELLQSTPRSATREEPGT